MNQEIPLIRTCRKMVQTQSGLAPEAPSTARATGIERSALLDLALKTAHSVPNITTEWAAQHMLLPRIITADLFEQLQKDQFLEVLGQAESFGYRYAITQRGRERVARSQKYPAIPDQRPSRWRPIRPCCNGRYRKALPYRMNR